MTREEHGQQGKTRDEVIDLIRVGHYDSLTADQGRDILDLIEDTLEAHGVAPWLDDQVDLVEPAPLPPSLRAECLAVLRMNINRWNECPVCDEEGDDHATDCRLAALIQRLEAPEVEGAELVPLAKELGRARAKFPMNRFLVEALCEELGEAARSAFPYDIHNMEWLQVAAMAMRLYAEGTPTNSPGLLECLKVLEPTAREIMRQSGDAAANLDNHPESGEAWGEAEAERLCREWRRWRDSDGYPETWLAVAAEAQRIAAGREGRNRANAAAAESMLNAAEIECKQLRADLARVTRELEQAHEWARDVALYHDLPAEPGDDLFATIAKAVKRLRREGRG